KGNTRVRTYEVDGKTYVGVVYKGLRAAEIPVSIPFSDAAARVVDLVTGADVAATIADGRISFTVNSKAMELGSYVITAAE
ncbi:MAG: hypothetical protein JXR97_08240, partial [Planctomycetes bacterium]|nr:hypothetical protein [Planctomycetota bacterium]